MKSVVYPFTPKSASHLIPGQFWSIPLENGTFACGRVIQLKPKGMTGSRTTFFAGLMDWVGSQPPTEESIASHKTLVQGQASYLTILDTGPVITGFRSLEQDDIEPGYFLDQNAKSPNCKIMKGFELQGMASDSERKTFPVFSTWGRTFIKRLAESRLTLDK